MLSTPWDFCMQESSLNELQLLDIDCYLCPLRILLFFSENLGVSDDLSSCELLLFKEPFYG